MKPIVFEGNEFTHFISRKNNLVSVLANNLKLFIGESVKAFLIET